MKLEPQRQQPRNFGRTTKQIVSAIAACSMAMSILSLGVAQAQTADTPPVKRIIFYNSGIGQIQHEGTIEDSQSVALKFSSHDISDVLKSLVFSDAGGGTVRAIEYQPAPEAEDVAANELGEPMTLAQLLQSHRGQTIELDFGRDQIATGKIFGVENRPNEKSSTDMIVLVSDAGLKSYVIADVRQFSFADPEVGKKLNLALGGIVKSREASQKQLKIVFDGKGKRDVKFAYVVDSPIWRMTYRLAWKNGEAYLQGWAHVDNVSGVDWDEIQLELRNGRPRALHSEIFSPVLAERPDAGNSVYDFTDGLNLVTQYYGFGATPRFSGSMAGDSWNDHGGGSGYKMYGGGGGGMGGGGFGGGVGGGGTLGGSAPRTGVDIRTSFEASALTGSAGRAVKYTIKNPVSLSSGSSAAIPVVEEKLPGELISLFNGDGMPSLAIEIENKSELAMVSGPVSIVRDNDFVGDSKLPRLDRNQKTIVRYGIDSAVNISSSVKIGAKKTVSLRLEKENLFEKKIQARTATWTVDNRDGEPRTIVLRVPKGNEGASVSPEPETNTENLNLLTYRFNAPAGEKTDFVVTYTKESHDRRLWSITTSLPFNQWAEAGVEVSKNDLQRMKKAVEITRAMMSWREKRSKAMANRSERIANLQRIRESVIVYGRETEEGREEIKRLKKIDQEIVALESEITSYSETEEELEKKREALVE